MEISRREFLAGASALLLAPPASGQPARLARKDCYFGLHFDLHPSAQDRDLGRDITDEMVAHVLDTCRPDFIQYDSKGDPGYLGFPSKSGMSAPGIVQDSLAIWRRVTAAHGVALYNHFSGIRDALAATKNPEWASVGPDGKKDPTRVSIFSAYEDQLMIPVLLEAALKYDLDGSWIDGDCWGVRCDYSEAAQRKFFDLTGDNALPVKPGDKDWDVYIEMQRDTFRQYVARYLDALHKAKPGYQITCNFIYSTFMPESPRCPWTFSPPMSPPKVATREARIQARYLSRNGIPWDLMSWSSNSPTRIMPVAPSLSPNSSRKLPSSSPRAEPTRFISIPRVGWIDDHFVNTAAEVGKFCRQRQRWSHHSDTLPEVGVLYSSRFVYKTGLNPFGAGRCRMPVEGAVDLMLSMGYSVDILPDWQLALAAPVYPLIVVPDWGDLGSEVLDILTKYVAGGGKLLLFGAENARLFSENFNLRFAGPPQFHSVCAADDPASPRYKAAGFPSMLRPRISWPTPSPTETRAKAWGRSPGGPCQSWHGNGCRLPRPHCYYLRKIPQPCPALRGGARHRGAVASAHRRLGPNDPALEVVLRTKDGQTLIHLINTDGAEVNRQYAHTGVVNRTGPIRLRLRMAAAPGHVFLEPEGTPLPGRYEAGKWHGTLPDLEITHPEDSRLNLMTRKPSSRPPALPTRGAK